MKKLLLFLIPFLFTITAYSQNGYSSVFLRVTDSATFVNSANTTAKHAANYADIWYSTVSGLFWKWSTVTNTYTMISEGGNFWKNAGTTTLTGNVLIDGGTNDIFIDTDGDWRIGNSANSIYTDIGALQMLWYSTAYSFLISGTLIDIQSPGNGAGVVVSANDVAIGASDDVIVSATDDITISAGGATSGHNIAISAITGSVSIISSAISITDGATMDITSNKHTLTTSSATRTFTQSYAGDYTSIVVTLNATSSTFTFPAGALCVSEGVASGDNTAALSGVSGDKYYISISKYGTNYYVVVKNFGQ